MEEFEKVIFRFHSNIEIMRISEESSTYGVNVLWHFIPLLEVRIKGIQYHHNVQFGPV